MITITITTTTTTIIIIIIIIMMLLLVYLIGNNAAEGENYILYANSYLMKCTVNNTYLKLGS